MREMDIACSEESGTWDTVPCRSGVDKNTEDTSGSSSRSEEVFLQRAVGEFLYSLTAPVFFQANDFMVPELVSLVLNSATNGRNDSALDLYAGVGLYSLPLARHFQQVIAVEYSPDAARLCTKNASNAGLVNVQTVCADVATWMNSVGDSEFSIVVLNPPRTGAGSKVMERIAQWAPETIIYVSCNPLTLVRDISRIPAGKYKVDLAEGLDLFPQTFHFETIVRLVRI